MKGIPEPIDLYRVERIEAPRPIRSPPNGERRARPHPATGRAGGPARTAARRTQRPRHRGPRPAARRAARGRVARCGRGDDGRAARSRRGLPAAPHRRRRGDRPGSSSSIPSPSSRSTGRPICRAARRGRAASPRTPTARCTWCSATTCTASARTLRLLTSRELPRDPALQQLRGAPRRTPRHQGLRRRSPRRHAGHPATRPSCSCSSPDALEIVARLHPAGAVDRPAVRRRATTSTWSATPACSGFAGTVRA